MKEAVLFIAKTKGKGERMQIRAILGSSGVETIVERIAENGRAQAFQDDPDLMRFARFRLHQKEAHPGTAIGNRTACKPCARRKLHRMRKLVGAAPAFDDIAFDEAVTLFRRMQRQRYIDFMNAVMPELIAEQIGVVAPASEKQKPGRYPIEAMDGKETFSLGNAPFFFHAPYGLEKIVLLTVFVER